MVKKYNGLIIAIVLVLAVALIGYSSNFSIVDNPIYSLNSSGDIQGINFLVKSDTNFSSEIIKTPDRDWYETHSNNIYFNSNSVELSSSMSAPSGGFGTGEIRARPINTLLYSRDEIIDTNNLSRLSLTLHRESTKSGGCSHLASMEDGIGTMSNSIILFNDNSESIIFSSSNLETVDYQINFYKNFDYYVVDVNGNNKAIELPEGKYHLLISSSYTGASTANLCLYTYNQKLNINKINIIYISETTPKIYNTTIYINNQTNYYLNQTINQTIYVNQTINETIEVTKEVQIEPTFIEKYGLAGIILLISVIIIAYIWRKK
jgi:hypothetical protein